MRTTWLLIAMLLTAHTLFSQTKIFRGDVVVDHENELAKNFENATAFQFDANELHQLLSSNNESGNFNLTIGKDYAWDLELYPFDIYSEDASIRVISEKGESFHEVPRNISFKGYIKDQYQSNVLFIIHEDFISAFIDDGNSRIVIESAHKFIDKAEEDLYVIYDKSNFKKVEKNKCGEEAYPRFVTDSGKKEIFKKEKLAGACYKVSLGVASDYLMYVDKASIPGVLNHVISVMAGVALNYEYQSDGTNFNDGIEFEIAEQVVSSCLNCDPWTSSTDSGDVLDDFTSWSTNGGFNASIDMGQFWTGRNFDLNIVGLAYNGQDLICNNSAFHVLENFSSDSELLRVATAHEIAHNFNADHAGANGYIMYSQANNTNSWYSTTKNTVSTEIADQGGTQSCIQSCAGSSCSPLGNVLVTAITSTGFNVSFSASTEGNYRIRVRDHDDKSIIHTQSTSSNSLTVSPASYEVCKIYEVIVENDCGTSYSPPVTVIFASPVSQGCAKFTADKQMGWSSLNVNFTDQSSNASSWLWDFGDGNTSTLQNPSHTFTGGGYYDVSLTINNNAHTMTMINYVVLLPEVSLPYSVSDGGNMDDEDFGAVSLTSGENSLWEKGSEMNYFFADGNAWVTDLDANLTNTDNFSVLYSPKFDFSSQGSYTFSFDLGMQYTFCHAPYALQVQYSTDDGDTWSTLGDDQDAQWYNRGPNSGCSILNSIFTDGNGWTLTNATGSNYSYDVSMLAGNPSVIFRFAFKVISGMIGMAYDNAGAMIDDVEVSALLPVDLVSFTGEKEKDQIRLDWKTTNEVNNDYFLVEKSNNGFDFFSIGEVEGNGTLASLSEYEFYDVDPVIGINYYRLTQYDFSGNSKKYNPIAISYGESSVYKIFPNPVMGDELKFDFLAENSGFADVEIYDLNGLKLMDYRFEINKGVNNYRIDIAGLMAGVYFIKVNKEKIERLIITK